MRRSTNGTMMFGLTRRQLASLRALEDPYRAADLDADGLDLGRHVGRRVLQVHGHALRRHASEDTVVLEAVLQRGHQVRHRGYVDVDVAAELRMRLEEDPGDDALPVALAIGGVDVAQGQQAVEHRPHPRHAEDLARPGGLVVVGYVDDSGPVDEDGGEREPDAAVLLAWIVKSDPVHDGQAEARVTDVPLVADDLDQTLVETPQKEQLVLLLRRLVADLLARAELYPEVLLVCAG